MLVHLFQGSQGLGKLQKRSDDPVRLVAIDVWLLLGLEPDGLHTRPLGSNNISFHAIPDMHRVLRGGLQRFGGCMIQLHVGLDPLHLVAEGKRLKIVDYPVLLQHPPHEPTGAHTSDAHEADLVPLRVIKGLKDAFLKLRRST